MSSRVPFFAYLFGSLCWLLAPSPGQDRWLQGTWLPTLPGRIECMADVDQDGDTDLIAVAANGANFSVLENDGQARLTAGQVVGLPAGLVDTRAVFADLDGDGDPEFVVASPTGSGPGAGLLLYRGLPGASFAAALFMPLTGTVLSLHRGNGNGDGIADLFVMHANGGGPPLSRWIFGAPLSVPVIGPGVAISGGSQAVVLDVDGDGLDDPVTTADDLFANSALYLHRTTTTGFALHASFVLPSASVTLLTPIDYDHDGDQDLLTARGASLMTVTNHQGAWSLGAAFSIIMGMPAQLHAGDWDGDGSPDLVMRMQSNGGVHALVRAGQQTPGVWTFRSSINIPGSVAGGGVGCVDLDGDGHLDFVDHDCVMFGEGTLSEPFLATWTWPNEDWDGDGDLDVFAGATVNKNDGSGWLTPRVLTRPTLPNGAVWGDIVATQDLDGDGLREQLVEVLVQVPFGQAVLFGVALLREQPNGTLRNDGPAAPFGQEMRPGQFVDSDGDGDLDLVTEQGIWKNDGAHYFTLLADPRSFWPFARGDIDGDNDLDLLAVGIGVGPTLAILRHVGVDSFVTEVLYASPTSTVVATPGMLADLDDDGDLDVAGLQQVLGGPSRTLLFANSGGTFQPPVTISFGGRPLAGDIDGDGMTDLAVYDQGRLRVLRRTGPGLVYDPPTDFASPPMYSLADFDQDGDLDACGYGLLSGRRFVAPGAGQRRQYGIGSPGAGDYRPLLSVTGALRPGLAASIRLVDVPGGSAAVLLLGTGPNDAPSLLLPDVQSYVTGLFLLLGFTANGAPGQPGAGTIEVPVSIPTSAAGLGLFLEYLVFDPTVPNWLTYSNGCSLQVGF